MCCPLEAIRPSPAQVCLLFTFISDTFHSKKKNPRLVLTGVPSVLWQTEYRNKCEFLISVGANGEDKTIGFRLGKYKGGSCAVVGPADTCHVSAETKRVVCEFQKFIRYMVTSFELMRTGVRIALKGLKLPFKLYYMKSVLYEISSSFPCRTTPFSVYSPETYEGHWKQLTVRTTRTKEAMAIVFFHPQVKEGLGCRSDYQIMQCLNGNFFVLFLRNLMKRR